MIHVLLTGILYDAPVRRIAKNGNPFTTAKLLADAGDGSMVWCNAIAFDQAGEHLAMLQAGNAVSMTGKARLNQWEDAEGNPRAGLAVTAIEVIALQQASRARPRKPRALQPLPEPASDAPIPFNDDLDFLNTEPAKTDAEGAPVGFEEVSSPVATNGTEGWNATEKPQDGFQRGGPTRAVVPNIPAKAPRKARKRRKLLSAPSPLSQD